MAVRRSLHYDLSRDITARARSVLNDERLTESVRKPLSEKACEDVGRAASGKADDDTYRTRGISLRDGDWRCGRTDGSTRCQMKEFTTRESHCYSCCITKWQLRLSSLRQLDNYASRRIDVCLWRVADIRKHSNDVRFRGEADMPFGVTNVRF